MVSLNDVHQRHQRKTGAAEATCPARQRAARTGVQDVFRPCSDCHGSIPRSSCAGALLEHDWPLKRFKDEYYLNSERVKKNKKQSVREMELDMFRPSARNYVSRMTFHNVKTIERYFSAVLPLPRPSGRLSRWTLLQTGETTLCTVTGWMSMMCQEVYQRSSYRMLFRECLTL